MKHNLSKEGLTVFSPPFSNAFATPSLASGASAPGGEAAGEPEGDPEGGVGAAGVGAAFSSSKPLASPRVL